MSYLKTEDVLAHVRRAQSEGRRCAIACVSLRGTVGHEALRRADIDPETLTVEQPALVRPNVGPQRWETTGELVERLVVQGADLVYLLSASTEWGNAVWTLCYAGEPLASVSDVEDALADGTIDVRAGELWVEAPAGSGLWSFVGVILDSVADHMRRRGLAVS